MEITQTLIEEIIRRVLSVTQAEQIILFGSAATGTMTPDSDVDIIVIRKGTCNVKDEMALIGEALGGLDYPFDVIVMPVERFEETKDVIGGIAYPANKYGRVIYEAA